MKLLSEATLDDQFNTQMDKIQQAIIKLEKIVQGFGTAPGQIRPVASQRHALEVAANDLKKLEAQLKL